MNLPDVGQELGQKRSVTVVGAGYVGLSLAVLLARQHDVCVLEINEKRVYDINSVCHPLQTLNSKPA